MSEFLKEMEVHHVATYIVPCIKKNSGRYFRTIKALMEARECSRAEAKGFVDAFMVEGHPAVTCVTMEQQR